MIAMPKSSNHLSSAALAAVPHLLWGLLLAYSKLTGDEVFDPASGLLFLSIYMGINILVLVIARQRGWPLWSASWYGYAAWSIMLVYGLTQTWLKWEYDWQVNNFIVVASLVALSGGYLWLYRRDQRKGILASLFLMPVFASTITEFVPNHIEAYLGLGIGIATAIVSVIIQYLPSWQADLKLALALNFLAGIALAYTGVYLTELPNNFISQPKLLDLLTSLGSYLLIALVYFFTPLTLWSVLDTLRRRPEVT